MLARQLTPFFNFLSIPYKGAAWVQWFLRSRHSVSFPELFIISIDGLSFGGTGKTPLIIALGQYFSAMKIPFAVVSRGYRGKLSFSGTEVGIHHHPSDVGDEALLLKSYFPHHHVFIGCDRILSLQKVRDAGIRVVILDDGFQSSHIQADYRILLINPEQPYYYWRHFRFQMRNQNLLLFYRNIPIRYRSWSTNTYRFHIIGFFDSRGEPVDMKDYHPLAFSALADNRRFLGDIGMGSLKGFRSFRDHHFYRQKDLDELAQECRKIGADSLVCSEKDYIKIRNLSFPQFPVFYTKNEIKLPDGIFELILNHAKQKGIVANTR